MTIETLERTPGTEEARKPKLEVSLSTADLAHPLIPYSIILPNRWTLNWAEKTGYDKVEWLPLIGPELEVRVKRMQTLGQLFKDRLSSAHVKFDPEATLFRVLTRRKNPLVPGEKLGFFDLAFADTKHAEKSLQKLEQVFDGKLPVVTYLPFQGRPDYHGKYQTPVVQPHIPFGEDKKTTAYEIVRLVEEGKYAGIWLDLYHIREATRNGERPFAPWQKTIETMLPYIKGVHFQAGRTVYADPEINSMGELKAIFGNHPNYNTELGRMLRMLKEGGFSGPVVVEITLESLIKIAGFKKVLGNPFDLRLENLQELHREIIDYIKRV